MVLLLAGVKVVINTFFAAPSISSNFVEKICECFSASAGQQDMIDFNPTSTFYTSNNVVNQ